MSVHVHFVIINVFLSAEVNVLTDPQLAAKSPAPLSAMSSQLKKRKPDAVLVSTTAAKRAAVEESKARYLTTLSTERPAGVSTTTEKPTPSTAPSTSSKVLCSR